MTQAPQWTGVGRTERGHVRATNQDALALLNDCGVWIVADGMGGHPAGDLAAQTAVSVATQRARERAAWLREHPSAASEFVADLVTSANQRIHDLMLAKPSLQGMGTTFVAFTITPAPMPSAHIAHLGD
ncbi:MAG TPA: protein phosphatase 2C domain-containing protein, partial [Nitrospiraceae bacterium]|nr:protein phosphatase 2C domain-containing protein [Nitrospiraceae bacterium]